MVNQPKSYPLKFSESHNTTAEVFFRDNDREGMAATGAIAAALGLSGTAAGMVASSMDEMKEPVCKVNFDLNEMHVQALLWNWPFREPLNNAPQMRDTICSE
ncbi:hypothetical protein ACWM4H_00030 [Xanthomonas oryzae pv. oryzae]